MAATLVLTVSSSSADEPAFSHDESPYQLRLDVDISAVVLGAVLWGGTSFIGNTTAPPFCGGTRRRHAIRRA
jgi:hypothetical protein